MLKQLAGPGQRQSFQGHTCQAWSVAPCIFEWRGTQRLGTGLGRQRSGLEREEEVWSEGGSVCLAGPVALPCMALPRSGTVFLVPDGGSVSHLSWITGLLLSKSLPACPSFFCLCPHCPCLSVFLRLALGLKRGALPSDPTQVNQGSEPSAPSSLQAETAAKRGWLSCRPGRGGPGRLTRACGLETPAGRIALD